MEARVVVAATVVGVPLAAGPKLLLPHRLSIHLIINIFVQSTLGPIHQVELPHRDVLGGVMEDPPPSVRHHRWGYTVSERPVGA
jgi:hypothetical protein